MILNGRYTYGCVLVHTEYKVMVGILILHTSVPIPSSSHGHRCIKETFVMWEHVWDMCDVRACIFCCRESYTCPSPTCEVPMVDHIRRFVHGHGCINVLLKKLDNPVPGAQENILLWSWCRRCKQVREAGGRWWLCKQLRWNGDRGVDNAHRWKPGGMGDDGDGANRTEVLTMDTGRCGGMGDDGDGANRTEEVLTMDTGRCGGWEMVVMVPKSGRRRREMWYQQNLKSSLKWILIIAFCLASKIWGCAHRWLQLCPSVQTPGICRLPSTLTFASTAPVSADEGPLSPAPTPCIWITISTLAIATLWPPSSESKGLSPGFQWGTIKCTGRA